MSSPDKEVSPLLCYTAVPNMLGSTVQSPSFKMRFNIIFLSTRTVYTDGDCTSITPQTSIYECWVRKSAETGRFYSESLNL
jgi:hypothetical protein